MKCFALIFVALLGFCPLVRGDSIDYQGAGTLSNHTAFVMGSAAAGHIWEVGTRLIQIDDLTSGHTTIGNLGVIDITTGVLTKCSAGLCFTGGTLDVDSRSNQDLFLGTFKSGNISVSNGITIVSAILVNGAATVIRDNKSSFSSQALVGASVPEPSSLALIATGVLAVGLVFRRRKEI